MGRFPLRPQLVETPDDEALSHNIEVGNISISYSDLSDNTPLRMTGKNLSVALNNLVYLGLNFGNGYLSEPRFRQAVSLAVDRQKIAASAYIGYAAAAKGPFPSTWKEAAGLQTMSAARSFPERLRFWKKSVIIQRTRMVIS